VHVVPGAELTHCPPQDIGRLTQYARRCGAQVVVCHGETITEPVAPGTNRAAIQAGVDLALPLYSRDDDQKRYFHVSLSTLKGFQY